MASNKEILDQAQSFIEKLAEIMTEYRVNFDGESGVYINSSFLGFLE